MPAASAPNPSVPIRYRVDLDDPVAHELGVELVVPPRPGQDTVDLVMPAWAPGSYMIRDFARHVFDLQARDAGGRRLPVERVQKHRWRVTTGGRAARVRYRCFAFEETVRTSYFDDRHAYFNGTSVFLYLDGAVAQPCELEVRAPRGWRISTALPAAPGRSRTSRFRAVSYDELVDSPFEVGTHEVHAFRVGGVPFEVALYGRTNADVPRLLRILRDIAAACGDLLGGFPFERYLFIIHALPARGGGLEHRASSTLDVGGLGFEDEKAYQRFAELAAHELFHAWNVKRIRDRRLGPFDYTGEAYTRLLWFHEGFTSYMEGPILLEAGLIDADTYLRDLAEEWALYARRPGRNVTPLSELSLEAWIKQYKPSENFTNRAVSYYDKGMWAAVVLEILTREATRGRRGVLDLFRRLWQRFGRRDVGFEPSDVEAAASAVAGKSMSSFFRRFIDGTEELPVPRLLGRAGVRVQRARVWDEEDDAIRARRLRTYSGLSISSGGGVAGSERAVVRNVVPGSPAWRAGLTYGDEIVAVDGARVTANSAPKRLADRSPGGRTRVAFFRKETLREATVTLTANPERRYAFSIDPEPTATARAIRRGWLGKLGK